MTLAQVRDIYRQAQELGTVEWIYLEGGEPFLYYPIMVQAAREAAVLGFRVGVLSNAYWASTVEDAVEWLLRPLIVGATPGQAAARVLSLLVVGLLLKNVLGYLTKQIQVAIQEGLVRDLRVAVFPQNIAVHMGWINAQMRPQ